MKFNDRERVTRTTIRLKDLFFEKSGDMFKFHKFGKLYPPQAWADLKFLSMDRDQLAAGQLKWTKNPIHNSLTQIPEEDKLTQKLAKEMFKNIMGCQWHTNHTARARLRRARFESSPLLWPALYVRVVRHGRQEVR